MTEPSFYIFGPETAREELTYWNTDRGWVTNFDKATPFDGSILASPLPEGTEAVLPCAPDGTPLAQYDLLPPLGETGNESLKSCMVRNVFERVY
jgi:hypothetical protein